MSTITTSPKRGVGHGIHYGNGWPAEVYPSQQPQKFTLHQLFACLVPNGFHKTDYRSIVAILLDAPALCEAIDINHVPHYTTLQKAEKRLLNSSSTSALLEITIKHAIQSKCMQRPCVLAPSMERVLIRDTSARTV